MNFTDKPPTEPGFYARKPDDSGYTRVGNFLINEETNQLQDLDTGEVADDLGGLWCRLVPLDDVHLTANNWKARLAGEVEKAWREGYEASTLLGVKEAWKNSRARRVATGEER